MDLLARAHVDAIAAAENVKIKSMVRGSRPEAAEATILSELEDDRDDDGPRLRVDLNMGAILTAKAVAAEPGTAPTGHTCRIGATAKSLLSPA